MYSDFFSRQVEEKSLFQLTKLVLNTLDAIEEAASSAGRVTGIATGFTDLDYKLSGLHPSELIIVAARPAMGKDSICVEYRTESGSQGSRSNSDL